MSIIMPVMLGIIFNPVLQELKHTGKVNLTERFLLGGEQKVGYKIELTNVGDQPIACIQ